MRVLVCGGRRYGNRKHLRATLSALAPRPTRLIAGDAPGADRLAIIWAADNDIDVFIVSAEWHRYGSSAGPIRNQRMLDDGKPELVIAFPGGRGTADMVRRAKAAGVPVREVA